MDCVVSAGSQVGKVDGRLIRVGSISRSRTDEYYLYILHNRNRVPFERVIIMSCWVL